MVPTMTTARRKARRSSAMPPWIVRLAMHLANSGPLLRDGLRDRTTLEFLG